MAPAAQGYKQTMLQIAEKTESLSNGDPIYDHQATLLMLLLMPSKSLEGCIGKSQKDFGLSPSCHLGFLCQGL